VATWLKLTIMEKYVIRFMKMNVGKLNKYALIIFDSLILVFGIVATGFAAVSIFFWFLSFANNTDASAGPIFPYVLPIITILVTGFAIRLSNTNKTKDQTYAMAAKMALIATVGFLVISGLVAEYRDEKIGADWAIFKWVILVGLYGTLITFWISISLIFWKLSSIHEMISNRSSSQDSVSKAKSKDKSN